MTLSAPPGALWRIQYRVLCCCCPTPMLNCQSVAGDQLAPGQIALPQTVKGFSCWLTTLVDLRYRLLAQQADDRHFHAGFRRFVIWQFFFVDRRCLTQQDGSRGMQACVALAVLS